MKRSSADAPLLASFASARFREQTPHGLKNPLRSEAFGLKGNGYACAELGCGAGFCLLPFLHATPDTRGFGIDSFAELSEASRENARRLGLAHRFHAFTCDVREIRKLSARPCCDVVLFNPPYWESGSGHASATETADAACRGPDALTAFARAAASLLVGHGHLFCIYPASRIVHLLTTLAGCGLGVRTLLPIRSIPEKPAIRILCEARRGMHSDTVLLPELVLYGDAHASSPRLLTEQARDFCPWLR